MELLGLLAIHFGMTILGTILVMLVMSITTALLPVLGAFAVAVAAVAAADIAYAKHQDL